jgi:hypothetical protein
LLLAAVLGAGAWLDLEASAQADDAQSVLVGGEEAIDACSSLGQVVGLRSGGDNYLSVRAAPDQSRTELDRLGAEALVHICDKAGEWLGIVYSPGDEVDDCGVSAPSPARAAYKGPCRSGWVHHLFVEVVAG